MRIANMLIHAANIDLQAAKAARSSVRALCRHLQAGVVHRVFPRRPVALVAPGWKSASVRIGRKVRHAASKPVRAASNVAPVPL
jgi:hypothetical protein